MVGPIVLLYLGFIAGIGTIVSMVRGLFDPLVGWDFTLKEVVFFSFMGIAGTAAFVDAVRTLADSPRFPGRGAAPDSSIGTKIDAFGITLIAAAVVVVTMVTGWAAASFVLPILAGWACANSIRLYRSFTTARAAGAS
ncbi:hypothetical protein RhoFasB10_00920 [Rhodococcus sp. B10]|nr:hypothetical protein [Rhodococcus sp. B10]